MGYEPMIAHTDGRYVTLAQCRPFPSDQTMRLANHGLTPLEIGELIELPDEYRTESHLDHLDSFESGFATVEP